MKHPARNLGHWLKTRRKKSEAILRVFAGQIALSPAQYSEVEHGIVHWIGKEQESAIVETLSLSKSEQREFKELLAAARKAKALKFEDVFTREQLEPMRTRSDRAQLTPKAKSAIMDAVFKPLC